MEVDLRNPGGLAQSVSHVWGGWVCLAVSLIVILTFCTTYIIYLLKRKPFRGRSHSEKCTVAVTVMALSSVLASAALVPLDVFVVSYMKNGDGSFKDWAQDKAFRDTVTGHLMTSYVAVYGVIFVMTFLVLPLAFFYNALGDAGIDDGTSDDGEGQDSEEEDAVPFTRRLCRALKYTLASLFLCGLLVLLGLFLPVQPDPHPHHSELCQMSKLGQPLENNCSTLPALEISYAEALASGSEDWDSSESRAKNLLVFLVNILNLVGMGLLVVYTAYGMSALPCAMIGGCDNVHSEKHAVNHEMGRLESQINDLKEEFSEAGPAGMNEFDRARLDRMERELRILARTRHELEQSAKSFFNRVILILRPFQLVFGGLFVLLGFLIFLSLLLTSVDKALHSLGPRSGYFLPNASLPNPVDAVLVLAQRAFPLDYIVYSGMVLFFLLSSLSGIQQIGIRFVWISVYRISGGKTRPQALVLMCISLTFLILATNVVMFSVVPDYTAYGSQHFLSAENKSLVCNHDWRQQAPVTECVMTRIALLILAFNYKIWIFGAAYYWAVWVFLASVVFGSLVAVVLMRKRSARPLPTDRQQLMEATDSDSAVFNRN